MSDDLTRRRFLKYGLVTASTFIASSVVVSLDTKAGFLLGQNKIKVGQSEANATCGFAANCAGGGGQCGFAANCTGSGSDGDGQCGFAANCAGGGGKCGFAANCAGS